MTQDKRKLTQHFEELESRILQNLPILKLITEAQVIKRNISLLIIVSKMT